MEEAVRSLHPSMSDLSALGAAHLKQLAPVILGPRGWAHFQDNYWQTWAEFKNDVNAEFALSKSQLNARFYNMMPHRGEASAAYVIRVERERKALGCN